MTLCRHAEAGGGRHWPAATPEPVGFVGRCAVCRLGIGLGGKECSPLKKNANLKMKKSILLLPVFLFSLLFPQEKIYFRLEKSAQVVVQRSVQDRCSSLTSHTRGTGVAPKCKLKSQLHRTSLGESINGYLGGHGRIEANGEYFPVASLADELKTAEPYPAAADITACMGLRGLDARVCRLLSKFHARNMEQCMHVSS